MTIATKRVYDFALPYTISGIQDSVGIGDLQSAGLWDQVPADLQAKMLAADSWLSSGFVATAAELDEPPDPVWTYIAAKVGLKWHEVPQGANA